MGTTLLMLSFTSSMLYSIAMTNILDIGSVLVRSRRVAGMSQRELAARLGTSQQQIARWEATSYRSTGLERVNAAFDALGIAAQAQAPPLAAETAATYGTTTAPSPETRFATTPVRDLGEIVMRIRSNGDDLARRGVSRVGVFGSFAVGEQTPDSDVDLLVEFSDRPIGLAYMEAPEFAESILGRPVDWVEPHLLRPRLRDKALSEAVYVWEA